MNLITWFVCTSSSLLVGTSAFITNSFGSRVSIANMFTKLPMSSPQQYGGDSSGNIETVEFTIYSDGRVEETVKGVRGANCHQVTDDINQMLGEVTASRPTEEMYEQEITLNQNVEQSLGDSDGMTSSW